MSVSIHRNVCYCGRNRCLTVINNVPPITLHVVAIGWYNYSSREGHLCLVHKEQFFVHRIEKMTRKTFLGRLNLIETDAIDVGIMKKGP